MTDEIPPMKRTFLTEYWKDFKKYGGRIDADSWEEARMLAGQRGEVVIGEIAMVLDWDLNIVELGSAWGNK
jgi:hypothetical protein